jgi:AraC-like DNA-binding protein
MDEQSKQEVEKHKKRSLRRYRKIIERIERLEKKLEALDDRITTIKSPNFSGMPRGGVPVTIDDLLSDKGDLEARIKRLKEKSREYKAEIREEIDSLEDYRYCEILEAHFIDGVSIEDIAEDLGYSERHTYTLYQEAISLLSVSSQ